MIIGTITNWGEVQGQINDAPNVLAGTISSAELMGGQIVGMRGMKGDKGDDGEDGHTPVITATRLGKVTVIAVDSVAVATIYDGDKGDEPVITATRDSELGVTHIYCDGVSIATILDGADGETPEIDTYRDTGVTYITANGITIGAVYDGDKGDKGDKGDTGATGADGHSPVITANKVGKVTTVYADGVAIATINDGQDGGGSGVFIAEIGTTSYSDIDTAFQGGKLVIGRVSGTGDTYFPLVVDNSSYYNYYSFQVTSGKFVFEYKIDNTDEWTTSQYVIATDDEATTSKKGLMSSSDKTKLDGIASGAEVNVQSDWNEADSSNDAYIKNKPTLFSGDYNDLTNKPTIPTVSGLLDVFYPIGSYYETSDTSFDPNVAWGGTWVQETSGQVHVSAGGSYSVSGALNNTSDGGASTVKLTSAQSGVPKHSHTYTRPTVVTGGGGHSHTATLKYRNAVPTNGSSAQPWAEGTLSSTGTVTIASNSGTHSHTLTGGGVADNTAASASSAHNNMQPYIVVNRWHRTA